MATSSRESRIIFLFIVGLLAWCVPGAGHFILKDRRHAVIIFVTIAAAFCIGIYIGSIGVINPVGAKPWYVAQLMNSPIVLVLGHMVKTGNYPVYGRPSEIGQIYTSIAGLLNLLCIVNAIYWAYLRKTESAGV